MPHGPEMLPDKAANKVNVLYRDDLNGVVAMRIEIGKEEWIVVDNPNGIKIDTDTIKTDGQYIIVRFGNSMPSYLMSQQASEIYIKSSQGAVIKRQWNVKTSVEENGEDRLIGRGVMRDFTGNGIADLILYHGARRYGLVTFQQSQDKLMAETDQELSLPQPLLNSSAQNLLPGVQLGGGSGQLAKKNRVVGGNDIDNNGIADLMVISNGILKVYLLNNDGTAKTPELVSQWQYPLKKGCKVIGSADIEGDADGYVDLLQGRGGKVWVSQGLGGTNFSNQLKQFNSRIKGKVMGVDGQGIVVSKKSSEVWRYGIEATTNVTGIKLLGKVPKGWKGQVWIDVNGDGQQELIVTKRRGKEVGVLSEAQIESVPHSIWTNSSFTSVTAPK